MPFQAHRARLPAKRCGRGGTTGDNAPNARFTVPSAALAARYGNTIEFRLTVVDNDNPSGTASTTVTFNINQGPTADIAVSASLKNPMDINWYDDDGNGVRDDADEVYNVEGIIDGPGENGNADNEWDIMEGARLTLDGSGSTDPDGRPIDTKGHDWDLVYLSNDSAQSTLGTSITAPVNGAATPARITNAAGTQINYGDPTPATGTPTAPASGDSGISNTKKIDIIHPDVTGGNNYVTLGQLTNGDGTAHDPVYAYYKLTVTDGNGEDGRGNATNSAIVKIVIHDVPQSPRVTLDDIQPTQTNENYAADYPRIQKGAPIPGATQKYVVLPGTTVNFIARGSDADGDNPTYSWEGAVQTDFTGMVTSRIVDPAGDPSDGLDFTDSPAFQGSSARWTAPRNVEDGTSYTVTVTATDRTGLSSSHSYELVVANNRRPEAVAPGELGDGPAEFGSRLDTRDGGDGGDMVPVPDNSQTTPVLRASGIQTLRGFGFDPDGPIAVFNWTELAYPTDPVIDTTNPGGLELGLDPGDSTATPPRAAVNDPNNDTELDLPETRADLATKAPRTIVLPRVPVLEIDNAFSEVASFDVPELDFGSIPKHLKVQIPDTEDWDGDGCYYEEGADPHTAGDATADPPTPPGSCFGKTPPIVDADGNFVRDGDGNLTYTSDPDDEMVDAVAVPIAFSVIDSWGVIDTDFVTVFIVDDLDVPEADAGGPVRQVNSGDFVRLSGILSSDPDPADQFPDHLPVGLHRHGDHRSSDPGPASHHRR